MTTVAGTAASPRITLSAVHNGASHAFYAAATRVTGTSIVLAETGGLKTTLLLNMMAHAICEKRPVYFFSMELQASRIRARLLSILMNVDCKATNQQQPYEVHDALTSITAANDPTSWAVVDCCMQLHDTSDAGRYVQNAPSGSLLLIDSPDLFTGSGEERARFASIFDQIRSNAPPDVSILTTSQVNRDGYRRELLDIKHFASVNEKAERCSLVLGMGSRADNPRLVTCRICKARDGWSGPPAVRLFLTPSLRLNVLDTSSSIFFIPASSAPQNPIRIGWTDHVVSQPKSPTDEGPDNYREQARETDISISDEDDDAEITGPVSVTVSDDAQKGFARFSRSILGTTFWKTSSWADKGLLAHIYMRSAWAQYEYTPPRTKKKIVVKTGQYATSVRQLAKQTGTTEHGIRKLLDGARTGGALRVLSVFADGTTIEAHTANRRDSAVCTILECVHIAPERISTPKSHTKADDSKA